MEKSELIFQWPEVETVYLKKLISLQNNITFGHKKAHEFDEFVLNNKEKFNNPDYLQVIAERFELVDDFFEEHFELCEFVHIFMKNNPDWKNLGFGLRAHMRLGLFEELFQEYSEHRNETITDKNGNKVREGDIIKFSNSVITYEVISKKGMLGAYEGDEFIFLKDCLKNFIITNR